MVILGVSIGTRTSGIAILANNGLIEWRTLSFKNSWSEKKADYIVRTYERYVRQHKVTVVSLKMPPATHATAAIVALSEKLVAMFTYYGCMVEYKTKKELKAALPEIRNTRQLMIHTVALYPMLGQKVHKELANRNKYHHRMVEAVSAAHYCKYRESITPD